MQLTTTNIRSLELPKGQADRTYWDDALPAFGLRLRTGGSRNWVVQYDIAGKTRRMTLGSVTSLDLGKARSMAKDLLAAVRLGRDPAMEKTEARSRASETFGGELLRKYLKDQSARLRPRSFDQVEHHLDVHARPLHKMPVAAIGRRTVAALLDEIAESVGTTTSNRVRSSLSSYFGWLMGKGLLDSNPVIGIDKAPEKARERVLADDELVEIWRALEDDQFGAIVKLLALTGQRRNEIGDLLWSEVDLAEAMIRLPGARTKNKVAHEVPLSPPALAILEAQPRRNNPDGTPRDLVFGFGRGGYNDWSKRKLVLDQRITATRGKPLPAWRLHDLRRTMSTVMHDRLGVLPHVVEAVLNHTGGHKAGPAGVYNKAQYVAEKRVAFEKWGEHLDALVNGRKPATVVKLHRA
jgi:integrase